MEKTTCVFDFNRVGQYNKTSNRFIWPLDKVQEINVQPKSLDENFIQSTRVEYSQHRINNLKIGVESEYFHSAIGPILSVAQFFGILPLSGISSRNPQMLVFKLKSFRTFYTCIVIISLTVLTFTSTVNGIKNLEESVLEVEEKLLTATSPIGYFGSSVIGYLIFLKLSPRWVELQQEWKMMETKLDSSRFNQDYPRLKCKFKRITLIIMLLTLAECSLWMINMILSEQSSEYFVVIFKKILSSTESSTPGNIIFGNCIEVFLLLVSFYATFIWSFTDLFIMLVSIGLAERYKYLNKTVLGSIMKNRNPIYWLQLREKYTVLSNLIKKTDNLISPLMLLSFAQNLCYICIHLCKGLIIKENGNLRAIFPFYAFGFLIGRTIAVTLLAARINDESKIVLPVVFSCPASCFTIETERLQHQLMNDDIALTGMNFFAVTRKFMLAIAGTIVTYEIVLLQINSATKNSRNKYA